MNSGSGKPLSSVGANGSHPGSLLGKMGGGNLLGMVDLDSSVKISNQYEEEGSSEFDSEQDSSESVSVCIQNCYPVDLVIFQATLFSLFQLVVILVM